MTADSRRQLLPHTSPTAVASYRAYLDAHQAVTEAWSGLFAEALGARAGRVFPARPERGEHIPAGARRGRWHWQLCATTDYGLLLPYCQVIAHPGRCRGHAQAPDLRTRTGRAMQADLDALENVRDPFLDPDLITR